MKNYLLIVLLLFSAYLNAQNISVKSFKLLAKDLDAQTYNPKTDQNGDKCAIIKVQTTEQGFVWEGDGLGIVSTEYKTGEYWLYIPHGAKRLTIKHTKLGILRDYNYPLRIQEGKVYELVLTTAKVTTIVEEYEIPTQWVVITSVPTGANIFINDEHKGTTPFQQELAEGQYNYRVEYPLYHAEAGRFDLVASDGKKTMELALKPNFGSIKVTSSPESGAAVFLDGKPTGKKTPCTLDQISSGKHMISLQREWYQPITKQINVEDEQTNNLEISLIPSFANVSITAEHEADVYIDGSRKGQSSWKGRLITGYHTFEAKKQKYYDDKTKLEIIAGEDKDIELNPKPMQGKLKVVSNPFDATIKLNGKEYGTTPLTIDKLLIGTYKLELSKIGFTTYSKIIEIKENQTEDLNAELLKGIEVNFTTQPSGATVLINGQKLGVSPCKIGLEEGTYFLEFKKNNYQKASKSIKVTNFSRNFSEKLRGEQLTIQIKSNPAGANIFLDNQIKGKSNMSFSMPAGKYDLTLKKKGFKSYAQTVDFSEKQQFAIHMEFAQKRSKGTAFLLSAVWPGAGQSYMKRGGAAWLSGFAVYGLAYASYNKRVKAVEAYKNYQGATEITTRNAYLEEAEAAHSQSQMLMYGAVGTWTLNMIWTFALPSDSKRMKNIKPIANYNTQSGTMDYGLAIRW